MCERDRSEEMRAAESGSFRQTADEVFGVGAKVRDAMAQNLVSANESIKRRNLELEHSLITLGQKTDRVFDTFAKLAREKIYEGISIIVTEQGKLGSRSVVQMVYGPYTLMELLTKYEELRKFDHYLVRCQRLGMPGQADMPFGDAL